MTDLPCVIMGLIDIIAGGLIILGFGAHFLGILFGITMIIKGGFSFI